MVDLSKNVIDLAISTIKKTHSVTIATVPEEIKANLEVRLYSLVIDTIQDFLCKLVMKPHMQL